MHASPTNHASLEQLLDIKDGLATSVDAHVQSCSLCSDELSHMQGLSQKMYDTANKQAPDHVWQRIQATAALERELAHTSPIRNFEPTHLVDPQLLVANAESKQGAVTSRWNSLNTAIYTLALSILVTGLIGFNSLSNQQTVAYQQSEELQASIEQLMLNSRGLESVLQRVNDQGSGSGLSAAERDVADRLYWRLMYVDQMIHENTQSQQQDPQRIRVLWGDRVNALTELNQLFYGGSEATADPKF